MMGWIELSVGWLDHSRFLIHYIQCHQDYLFDEDMKKTRRMMLINSEDIINYDSLLVLSSSQLNIPKTLQIHSLLLWITSKSLRHTLWYYWLRLRLRILFLEEFNNLFITILSYITLLRLLTRGAESSGFLLEFRKRRLIMRRSYRTWIHYKKKLEDEQIRIFRKMNSISCRAKAGNNDKSRKGWTIFLHFSMTILLVVTHTCWRNQVQFEVVSPPSSYAFTTK